MAAPHRVKRSPKKKKPQKQGLSSRQQTWLWCGLLVLLLVVVWLLRHNIAQWIGYSPASRTQSATSLSPNTADSEDGSASTYQVQSKNISGTSRADTATSTTTNRSSTTSTTSEHSAHSSTTEGAAQETQSSLLSKVLSDIGIGDSKQDLLGLGIDPGTCVPLDVALLGKQEVCTLTSGDQALSVTLLNNKVIDIKKLGL